VAAIVVGLIALSGGFLFVGASARKRHRTTVNFQRGHTAITPTDPSDPETANQLDITPTRSVIESHTRITPAGAPPSKRKGRFGRK
jgi:hypothetical protein